MKNYLLVFLFFAASAVSVTTSAQAPTFDCYLTNDTFISPTIYQFDLYLLRTGSNVFEYAAGQWGITFNSACFNGGTATPSMVAGSSQLSNSSQVPIGLSFPSTFTFNIASKSPPGAGSGSIISDIKYGCDSPGTRIGTFRLTNSVQFVLSAPCPCPNFNFASGPGKTASQVLAYVGGFNTNVTSLGAFYGCDTVGNCLHNSGNGVKELLAKNTFSIFPNPASSEIIISTQLHNKDAVKISITDILGTTLKKVNSNFEKNLSVDIKMLAPGIYFVKIENGREEWVGKFVKD